MTEERSWHRDMIDEPVTKPLPETAGNEAWKNYFAAERKKTRDYVNKSFEDMVDALARRFGEERNLMRSRIDAAVLEYREEMLGLRVERNALKDEIETLKKQFPRLVKSG